MAAITSDITSDVTPLLPGDAVRKRELVTLYGASTAPATTYYFRRVDGTRGSVTDMAEVPNGAVIELVG